MHGNLRIASTQSMANYAAAINYHVQTFPDQYMKQRTNLLISSEKKSFADGSFEVIIRETVRDDDVILIAGSANTEDISFAENELELYYTLDALRRASPARITIFEPYCAVSRSDRATTRNSVGMWIHYKVLQGLGMDHYITYLLHSDKSKSLFDPVHAPIDDLPTAPLVMEYIIDEFITKKGVSLKDIQSQWVFCSVDAGGEDVARMYANSFHTPLCVAYKERDYEKTNHVDAITMLTSVPLEGKTVWIVDDMIDTGNSMIALIEQLKKEKVAKINIAISHGLFSPPALDQLTAIHTEGLLDSIVTTNTVLRQELQELAFIKVVDTTRQSASIVVRMHEGESLSPFFDPFDVEQHFLRSSHKFDRI